MSKGTVFTVGLIVFLSVNNVWAAYIGGPLKILGKGNWDFTLESSNIGDRDLVSPKSTNQTTTGVVRERTFIDAKVAYGVLDALDIYFKIGSSELELDTKWADGSRTKLKYDEANLFGGGVKYIYTADNGFLFGGDLQFILQQGNEVQEITEGSIKAVITKKGEAEFNEYQLSFFAAKSMS